MPDLMAYLALTMTTESVTSSRAVKAWGRIQDRSTSVTLYRNGAAQAAQTVRLEYLSSVKEQHAAGEASIRSLLVFGVEGHPDTSVPDTGIAVGDLFTHDGGQYRVIDIVHYPGEIQARTERIS